METGAQEDLFVARIDGTQYRRLTDDEFRDRAPTWSHDGILCTGESYKSVVKLTFPKGASLEDPARLFNASLDGNARRAIDLHEGEEVDADLEVGQAEGCGKHFLNAPCDMQRVARPVDQTNEDAEFIAADPGEPIARPQRMDEAARLTAEAKAAA